MFLVLEGGHTRAGVISNIRDSALCWTGVGKWSERGRSERSPKKKG